MHRCTITNTLNTDTFAFTKIWSPQDGGEATVSLSCTDGTASPAGNQTTTNDGFTWTVSGFTGPASGVNCTVTETVPNGYSASGNPAGTCSASLETGSCTITNTLIPVTPTIVTSPSSQTINLGGDPSSVTDHITVTVNSQGIAGTVDVYVCQDDNANPDCTTGGTQTGNDIALDGNGEADSDPFTPTVEGFYCFRVEFAPANTAAYSPAQHTNIPVECFQVTAPDTDIAKTADADTVNVGGDLSYTITVTNNGSGPTNDTLTVVDTLPDGLTNISVTENGWSCNDESITEPTSGATMTCTYDGVVNAGASAPSIVVDVTVPDDSCDNLTNQAVVSGADAGNDTADNTASVTTNVDGCASDLDITKSGDTTALFGDTVQYLIQVTNSGNNQADDVVVTDNLDNSLNGVTALWDTDSNPAVGGTACTVGAGNNVSCSVGSLGIGESAWVLVTGTVDSCDDLTNQAVVNWNDGTTGTPDSNTSNIVTTTVTCGAITIVKDTDPETTGINFSFGSSFGGFVLQDDQSINFNDLESATYTFTETNIPAGWDLTDISCTNDGINAGVLDDVNLGNETVEITLRAGDDITCVFNNVEEPPVVIVEETATPTPTATSTPVAQVGGIITTPTPTLVSEIGGVRTTPTPTLVSEIESVRSLPQTGNGGPMADATHGGASFPWAPVAVASVLAAIGLAFGFGRRRRGDAS